MITNNYSVQKEVHVLEKFYWVINQIDSELTSIIKIATIEFFENYERCLIFVLEGLERRCFGKMD
jgi:hypothetical protein